MRLPFKHLPFRHDARPRGMVLAGAGISLLMLLPLLYIAAYALRGGLAEWLRLWHTSLPALLFNTISLALGTAALTFLVGVSLAWIVTRYEFPGRRTWSWLLALPLGVPPYIMAYVWTDLFLPGGWAQLAWQAIAGEGARLPLLYGRYWATVWVLGLATYPYVYLLVRASLSNHNVTYEEAAQIQGASRPRRFLRVTLPLQRPAIAAGLFLVVLYAFSDFGLVSMMRFHTFTRAIYLELAGRGDRVGAAMLALVLIGISALLFWRERRARSRSRFYQTGGRFRRLAPQPVGRIGVLAIWAYLLFWFGSAFGLVVAYLIYRSAEGLAAEGLPASLWGYAFNSVFTSGAAATISVFMIVPVAYLATRYRDPLYQAYLRASYMGYVLPGPIIGVGVLFIAIHLLSPFYGTVAVVILAYLIRFLPEGLQAQEAAFHQIKPHLEEAARIEGDTFHRALLRVVFPLAKSGILTGWLLVFVSAMKELPATLLLRPLGFDTLAIRIWIETSEEFYALAAPAALILIGVSAPLFGLLISRDLRRQAT